MEHENYEAIIHELKSWEDALRDFEDSAEYEEGVVEGEPVIIYKDSKTYNKIKKNLVRISNVLQEYESQEVSKIINNQNKYNVSESKNTELKTQLQGVIDSDSDFGLNIDELKEDPLHIILKKNKFYKLFYSLYRLQFNGLYEDIPLHFIVFVQNILRYQGKLILPERVIKPLNCMIISASGKAKTARQDFCINIAKELKIPMEPVSQETSASLRGSVEIPVNHEKYEFDIVPGSIKSCLLFIDEFRNALLRTKTDIQFKSYLLELAEKTEMKADTLKAKQVLVTYKKWTEAVEKATGDEKKELLAMDLKCETDYYRMDFPTHNLLFKSKAGLFIYSQPITKQSSEEERRLQKSFCVSQGYFNRFIFRYNPTPLTPKDKIKYKADRIVYIKRMKSYHKVTDDSLLLEKYTNEIVNLLKNLPKITMKFSTEFLADMQTKLDNSISDEIYNLLNSSIQTTLRENMDSYTDRMTYNMFTNLVYVLAYINGKDSPEEEEIKASIDFCNKSMKEYYNYLQEIHDEPSNVNFNANKIYNSLILDDIINYFEQKTIANEVDIYEKYQTLTELMQNVKRRFIMLYSENNWSKKRFLEIIDSLESAKILKKLDVNPDTKKCFEKNRKKLVVLKPYTNNRVLINIDELKKIRATFR